MAPRDHQTFDDVFQFAHVAGPRILDQGLERFRFEATDEVAATECRVAPQEVLDHFARLKQASTVPVCAGFGIRSRDQVVRMAPYVDGVIVGSALVEVIERGEDPAAFLASLRG